MAKYNRMRGREEVANWLRANHNENVARAFLRQGELNSAQALKNVLRGYRKREIAEILSVSPARITQLLKNRPLIEIAKTDRGYHPDYGATQNDRRAIRMVRALARSGGYTYRQIGEIINNKTKVQLNIDQARHAVAYLRRKVSVGIIKAKQPGKKPAAIPDPTTESIRNRKLMAAIARRSQDWTPWRIPRDLHEDFQQDVLVRIERASHRIDESKNMAGYVRRMLWCAVRDFNIKRMSVDLGIGIGEACMLSSSLKWRQTGKGSGEIAKQLRSMNKYRVRSISGEKISELLGAYDNFKRNEHGGIERYPDEQ